MPLLVALIILAVFLLRILGVMVRVETASLEAFLPEGPQVEYDGALLRFLSVSIQITL